MLDPNCLRVYLVPDDASLKGRPITEVVLQAVQGGVGCVQLREKTLDTRDFYARAVALMQVLSPFSVPLVINDRIDVALACGAQGVHLGQGDMPPDAARRLLPEHVFIGWSVESLDDVWRSAAQPVDYLGVSPVYDTPTKIDTQTPWRLDGLRRARAATKLPLVAIGGVHAGNAADVLAAGADGLAVISAIFSAPDPRSAAMHLKVICDVN